MLRGDIVTAGADVVYGKSWTAKYRMSQDTAGSWIDDTSALSGRRWANNILFPLDLQCKRIVSDTGEKLFLAPQKTQVATDYIGLQ